jgi:hypothetical protein
MDKFLEHVGYGTPLVYAAAAYWLFSWLDANTSNEAKAALASTMRLKELRSKDVAASLIEIFDRIYTYPLLRWSAFFRSVLFTLIVTAVFVFEVRNSETIRRMTSSNELLFLAKIYALTSVTNALSDYLSLFMVRPWLAMCGNRPAFALLSGTVLAVIVVCLGTILRGQPSMDLLLEDHLNGVLRDAKQSSDDVEEVKRVVLAASQGLLEGFFTFLAASALPALAVFAWLPLFALGILAIRAIAPLSWLVAKAQWALNEGDKHPLKAVGCVAAVIVFAIAAVLQRSLTA